VAVSRPLLSGNVDLLTWFSEEEREMCENCRERSAVSLPAALASFCLRCGAITIDGVRVDIDGRVAV
jgi:riboflavin synthase alpha subunit